MTIAFPIRVVRVVAFIVASAATFAPRAANAQPSAPSETVQQHAAEHKKRAFEAVKRADAEAARLEFAQAYDLVPSANTLWNLMVAEMDSARSLDALKHLRDYLADPRAQAQKKERGKSLLVELMSRVGHLRITAAEGAVVTLDGAVLETQARQEAIDVAPGTHVVEVAWGDAMQHKDVNAPAGEVVAVSFDAPSKAIAPIARPAAPPKLAPPKLAPAAAVSLPIAKSSRVAAPPMATWIAGGVAATALGAGIAFSLAASSKKDALGSDFTACAVPDSPQCLRLHDLRDTASRYSDLAWVSYGVSIAAVVTGGAIWLLSPRRARADRAASLAPLASPGVVGVQFRTGF